ncbi:GNAT family N-acetyltransferase [Massilia sp. METH4]|uniref:GNAT family N-acetyltransferase n=1 Tax=Massilia sp. METH4 TaxID=3123041 RepID=UPI0030D4E006
MTDFTIRPFTAGEWTTWRALRLAALADSPDAFGSTLADAQARADATWQALLAQAVAAPEQLPLLAEVAGESAGLTWAQVEGGNAVVYQVWVAPDYRGRGIARALLERAIGWARDRGATVMELGVTAGDTPAVRLYRRLGFEAMGAPIPMPNRNGLHEQPMRLVMD